MRVVVPATCANLGPGFDCLGLALNLHNETEFAWSERDEVEVDGEGATELPKHQDHLCIQAARRGLQALGETPRPLRLRQRNRIPLTRGLGSSASAIVAGLAAARALVGAPPDPSWLLSQATAMEGHPDNVGAAIYGGITAAFQDANSALHCLPLSFPQDLQVALAVPSFHVSTEAARHALPREFPLADVSYSLARAAVLVGALCSGQLHLLREATQDRIHTPSRGKLIGCYAALEEAAVEAGALGVFISGSGPTVAAFVRGTDAISARPVAAAMADAFVAHGFAATPHWLEIDRKGVRIETAQPL